MIYLTVKVVDVVFPELLEQLAVTVVVVKGAATPVVSTAPPAPSWKTCAPLASVGVKPHVGCIVCVGENCKKTEWTAQQLLDKRNELTFMVTPVAVPEVGAQATVADPVAVAENGRTCKVAGK